MRMSILDINLKTALMYGNNRFFEALKDLKNAFFEKKYLSWSEIFKSAFVIAAWIFSALSFSTMVNITRLICIVYGAALGTLIAPGPGTAIGAALGSILGFIPGIAVAFIATSASVYLAEKIVDAGEAVVNFIKSKWFKQGPTYKATYQQVDVHNIQSVRPNITTASYNRENHNSDRFTQAQTNKLGYQPPLFQLPLFGMVFTVAYKASPSNPTERVVVELPEGEQDASVQPSINSNCTHQM